MTQLLLLPLMVYASCGLVLSLAAHVVSMFGVQLGEGVFKALHFGIFPLWFVAVLLSMKMIGRASRGDFWKIALSGCPPWMRYMTQGFMIYAVVNFAIFFVLSITHQPDRQAGGAPPAELLHGFSGHWMAFYSMGLAIVTTAYRRGLSNLQCHCPFGHDVGWSDKFCPTCGASIPVEPGLPQRQI